MAACCAKGAELRYLGVLDLRVGHRCWHQMERCHESCRVALHLSGDLDLAGSHLHFPTRPSLPPFSPPKKLPMCDRGFAILAGFIARCQARFVLIGPTGRAVLLKIKFTHLHKRSRPCVLRRRNASTPPTTHSPDTRSVFRRTHSGKQLFLVFFNIIII